MQRSQVLDELACKTPPQRLWRVNDNRSRAIVDDGGNLIAADSTSVLDNSENFKQAVEQHLNWASRRSSCFISLFSDWGHARNWASRRARTQFRVVILEIDTTQLDCYYFGLRELASSLEISESVDPHEYLALHRIPNLAILRRVDFGCLEEQDGKAMRRRMRAFDSHHHYVDDLNGCYDTDDECEEQNANDDMIKILEEIWSSWTFNREIKRLVKVIQRPELATEAAALSLFNLTLLRRYSDPAYASMWWGGHGTYKHAFVGGVIALTGGESFEVAIQCDEDTFCFRPKRFEDLNQEHLYFQKQDTYHAGNLRI